jgi:hypothetical protein
VERESPQEELRLFTTAEADALVPALQISFAAIGEMRRQIETLLASLAEGDPSHMVEVLRGEEPPARGHEADLERVRELIGELGQTVEGIAERGVIVKDLEPGVVDFPAVHEGRVVLLCWQFGEPAVGYFHLAEEGFEERQPLGDAPSLLQ